MARVWLVLYCLLHLVKLVVMQNGHWVLAVYQRQAYDTAAYSEGSLFRKCMRSFDGGLELGLGVA